MMFDSLRRIPWRSAMLQLSGRINWTIREPSSTMPYPLDVSGIVEREAVDYRDGVPVVRSRITGQLYQNAMTVCFVALSAWDRVTGQADQDADVQSFDQQVMWLMDNQRQGAWSCPVPIPQYGLGAGSISAMTQGLALSVLVRACQLWPDKRSEIERVMDEAAEVLCKSVDNGGCTSHSLASMPFLEEVPSPGSPHILNGAVFALFGLQEACRILPWLERPANEALCALSQVIHSYDIGYWTSYDLASKTPASLGYHSLHCAQMRVLASRNPEYPSFADAAHRWTKYQRSLFRRSRAFLEKSIDVWRQVR